MPYESPYGKVTGLSERIGAHIKKLVEPGGPWAGMGLVADLEIMRTILEEKDDMKLYKVPNAPVGERWQSQKAQAEKLGGVEEIVTPKAGRQGMAEFLNANEQEVAGSSTGSFGIDPLEHAELRAVAQHYAEQTNGA